MCTDVDRLVRAYRDRVQPCMCGLPVYNAALRVEAVGFEVFKGRLCGVLVTPWFMNLVLLPGADDDWAALASGKTVKVTFPAGDYHFKLSVPEGIDAHLSLPLFTTVQAIPDQHTACSIATEVLRRLYEATGEQALADPVESELDHSVSQRTLSRRELLRGRLLAEDRHNA
jgi:[NiFe] hydrogenase assembly HybE family chaperone